MILPLSIDLHPPVLGGCQKSLWSVDKLPGNCGRGDIAQSSGCSTSIWAPKTNININYSTTSHSVTWTWSVSFVKNLVLIFLLIICVLMKSFVARHSLICSKINCTFSSFSIEPNVSTCSHDIPMYRSPSHATPDVMPLQLRLQESILCAIYKQLCTNAIHVCFNAV